MGCLAECFAGRAEYALGKLNEFMKVERVRSGRQVQSPGSTNLAWASLHFVSGGGIIKLKPTVDDPVVY